MESIDLITKVQELGILDLQAIDCLYHGTYTEDGKCEFSDISKINLFKGKKVVDFGPGFYLTPDHKQAERRAISVSKDKPVKKGENYSGNLAKVFINKIPTKKEETKKCDLFL